MFKVAVGHSNDPDSLEASLEVLAQCQQTLGSEAPQAGLLFSSFDFDHAVILKQIDQVFPGLELIGCTTDAEMSSVLGFQQDSLTLMLFCSDQVEFKAAVGRQVAQNPQSISAQTVASAQAQMQMETRLCIALPESLTTNISDILRGLQAALADVPIVGGAAADNFKVLSTRQFYKTEVLEDSVPLLLLGGQLDITTGVASGWQPMGKPGIITKAEGSTIYEIDHQPALDFYRYYFDQFKPDATYPLAVFPPGQKDFFLRAVSSMDPTIGSLKVLGDVPIESRIQITDAAIEDIVSASQASLAKALEKYPMRQPAAALFFSCAWRRLVMGTRSPEEYLHTVDPFKTSVPAIGFYTFGELAPLMADGQTFLHNTTFVTVLLGSN